MALATATATVAGTTAVAAYLNARLHLQRDIESIYGMKQSEGAYGAAVKNKRHSPWYPFEASTQKYANALCLWSRSGTYTWQETYNRSLQYAGYFLAQGVQPGEIVGLYIQNCPEFMFITLGLWAIGSAPGMINYNLASEALLHCVRVSGAKILLTDAEAGCQERIQASHAEIIGMGINVVVHTEELKSEIASSNIVRPVDMLREGASDNTPVCLIYTSGTTGLPKAFGIENKRIYIGGLTWGESMGKTPGPSGDRCYNCMPLYHATGWISSISCMMSGVSLALGQKFSTSGFWDDVRDSQATGFIYVGETARYLLSAPPSPLDKQHNVRFMFGNGLRPDVWHKFQERFGVSEVCEFFSSTEGMFLTLVWSRSGYGSPSVGVHGWLIRRLLHNTYVPVATDPETGNFWRDPKTGFAKRVSYAEGGEILVKMADPNAWPGYYKAAEASNKKIVRHVFKKGDWYYCPGDALRRTDDGVWQFMDRLGDTFRWKGENVSTAEVSQVMGTFPGIHEANVYGVLVPHSEGRAGCAAVAFNPAAREKFDWRSLTTHLRAKLPRYAVPLFIRVMEGEIGRMALHNNKQNKVLLRLEGADPRLRGTKVRDGKDDAFYWLPPWQTSYVPFKQEDWDSLEGGRSKL